MAKSLTTVNVNADTFLGFINKTNAVINALATEVMTANNNANGAVTSGNSYLNGIFGANSIAATRIRGGNVQSTTSLIVDSNVAINAAAAFWIGNSTVNTYANSSYLDVITAEITTANIVTGTIAVGSINALSGNLANWGNTTVNTMANSIQIAVSNGTNFAKITATTYTVGNSTVNCIINSSAIAFSNSSGSFSLDAQGSVSQTEYASRFKFANVTFQGTSLATVDSFLKSDYKACEYVVTVKDLNANSLQYSTVLVASDGSSTTALSTEYATLISNGSLGLFSASSNSTHVLFQFTPTVANTSVSYGRTGVNV